MSSGDAYLMAGLVILTWVTGKMGARSGRIMTAAISVMLLALTLIMIVCIQQGNNRG